MYDIAIIGCGITGAACAFELAKYKLNILILEKENDVAIGSTKANSAIIHAGYDPVPGTLMAKLNVRGAELAQDLCEKLDVPYDNCGALVLAFRNRDIETLEELKRRGDANGVKGLRIIGYDEVKTMEPHVSEDVKAALYAPTSAIVSPWEYCLALAETAVKNGAEIKLSSNVKSIEHGVGCWNINTDNAHYQAKYIINAAGVNSADVHDMACEHEFDILPSRGQYYLMDKCEGHHTKCTIFQCPNELGKGVLLSPTVHGNLIVGPDSELVVGEDKSTTASGLNYVKAVASKSIPDIDFRNTIRNFAGVRARSSSSDFIIKFADGVKGFIDAAGICSPGLSSAPAIAEYIAMLLKEDGLALIEKENFICERKRVRFKKLSDAQREELIKKNPAYGHIVCRCETITEGEILDCFNTPIPPRSVDGVKRRVSAGMGRCQGGFCGPNVVSILAKELNTTEDKIVQESSKSKMLFGKVGEL